MQLFILRNWLILAITSALVAIYVSIFDGFWDGKAYMFVLLGLVFAAIYYFRLKRGLK